MVTLKDFQSRGIGNKTFLDVIHISLIDYRGRKIDMKGY